MKKMIVALAVAFLMAAGLATESIGAAHAAPVAAKAPVSKCGTRGYAPCPKAPRPGHKPPRAHAGHTGWMRLTNPRHLGGKMRIVIVGPHGHKRVVTRWTFKKDVSVKMPKLRRGKYRVWVFFYPKGHYRPVYPKFSFTVRR